MADQVNESNTKGKPQLVHRIQLIEQKDKNQSEPVYDTDEENSLNE